PPRPPPRALRRLVTALPQPAEHDASAALVRERLRGVEVAALVHHARVLGLEAVLAKAAYEVQRLPQRDGRDHQELALSQREQVRALPDVAGRAAVADAD